MKSSRGNTLLVFACLLAAFALGVVVLILSPILGKNIIFAAAIPFAALALLAMLLKARWMMLILLYTRSLLDPVLNLTKIGSSAGDSGGAGMGAVLNLLVIVLVAVLFLRFPKTLSGNKPLIRRWLIFICVCALSIVFSPERGQSVKLLMNLTTYLCIVIIPLFLIKDPKDKRIWIKHLFFSSFIPVGFAIVGAVTKNHIFYSFDRLQGTFTHANILAFYLVLVIAVVFYILRSGEFRLSGIKQILLYIYMIVVGAALIMTGTRSAWVACFSFFFIYSFLKERRIFFVLLAFVPLLIFVPQVRMRVDDLMTGTGETKSEKLNAMTWRLKLWTSSLDSIKRRPVLGYGLGSFEYYSSDFFALEKKKRTPAHNAYLELLFETGLLGLVSYLMIYFSVLKAAFLMLRQKITGLSHQGAILFSLVVGYVLVCFSDNTLYYLAFNWYFWFFIGLMMHCFQLIAVKPREHEAMQDPV